MHRLEKRLRQGFESSCFKTREFRQFATWFRNDLKKVLGANEEIVNFNVGHFYVSGFIRRYDGSFSYFSISDVRFFPDARVLVRTAKHEKDYTGGTNHYQPYSVFFSRAGQVAFDAIRLNGEVNHV